MKSLKTKAFSYGAILCLLISGLFALVPIDAVSATHDGNIIHQDESNCTTIIGVAGNPSFPSYAVFDVAVYIRLEGDQNASDWERFVVQADDPSPSHPDLPGNHGFRVTIPDKYIDPLIQTRYTARAMEYTVSEQSLWEGALIGPCGNTGSEGSGNPSDDGSPGPITVDESFGPPPGSGLLNTDDLEVNTGPVVCLNPDLPGSDDNPIACQLIRVINFLSLGVGIIIAIALIYSGILYITSRGDPNQTKRAVNHAWQAGVALVLFIFGWALLNFLVPGGVLSSVDQSPPAACLTDPNVTCE